MKDVIKSDTMAFILGLLIIFFSFAASDVDAGSAAIAGIGLILWVALWAFRWAIEKDE